MKPTPEGWPQIASAVYYNAPPEAIDWLCNAFGFEVRLKIEGADGSIQHSELVFGQGVIMVADAQSQAPQRSSPLAVGGANTQSMMVFVDDVESHFTRAEQAGAKIISALQTFDRGADYWVDRGYEAADPEGHHWWFFQRLR